MSVLHEIGCNRTTLATIRAQPGGFPASARLSGPRERFRFPSGLRSFLPPKTKHLTNAMLLSPRILSILFFETRQSAFIFQA
jgi:hypothetical protein